MVRSLCEDDYGLFAMERLVVVASGCPRSLLSELAKQAELDARVRIVSERERRGKAEALNRIMGEAAGEYLVLLNADAEPGSGAIESLLGELAADEGAGCVSARPVFNRSGGLLSDVLGIMWSAHNLTSLRLNHASISNHSSDELLVVRRNLLRPLPRNLVNDGAYIGGRLKAGGHRVRFSQKATVTISVPRRPRDLIAQRRRIIFGHFQVWRKLGKPPTTVESLLVTNPVVGIQLLASSLAASPRLILSLPAAVVSEILSTVLAIGDSLRSTTKHVVWRRIES
jgi:cellulose synthase/poly-beta-1,6-N-acetylglucosamine synthase-like glycosyltransferase